MENNQEEIEKVEGEVVSESSSRQLPASSRLHYSAHEESQEDKRTRIRDARIPEGTIFHHAKPKPSIKDTGDKVVGVYARVSTNNNEQISSMENQRKFYKEYIDKNPNWTMLDIYADEGKSGTSMRHRTEFRRLLQDAFDKKLDLILCASVSRFARNISDCIEQVNNLRTANPSHPVGVYFETEGIYTLDPDCDQTLDFHAMLADWESRNKSRRMILSYDQRICTGQFPVSDLLGFRHTIDGQLIIVEEEAKTVKYIYLARILGYSYDEIAETLTEKGRTTLKGRTDWNGSMVSNIMDNERRWGDLEARKTIVVDYKKGKTTKNKGQREGATVPNHHKGIVSREIAAAARLVDSNRIVNGVPDVGIIERGSLKGFVSINPGFKGVSRDTLLSLSGSVYTDEEYQRIEHEMRIINGEEHSEILSIDFTGYCVPYSAYFISQGTPTLTITGRRLKFNKKCFDKMRSCKNIEFLYHPILQMIVIRECDDNSGITWQTEDGRPILSFSSPAFCKAVYEQMDWISDLEFRFRGITKIRDGKQIIIFYLDEPQIVSNKAATKVAEALGKSSDDSPMQYIPCHNRELDNSESPSTKRPLGISYEIRSRRNKLVDNLSASDITAKRTIVDNPFFGKIPARPELEAELEQLLLSM